MSSTATCSSSSRRASGRSPSGEERGCRSDRVPSPPLPAVKGGSMAKASDVDRVIAGIRVPDSPLMAEVLAYAQGVYQPYLFNHAMRSWLFAAKIALRKGADCDLEVVAAGTLLHDIGLEPG